MLFLVYFITAFIAVVSDDLVEVSYYFEENYLDVFSDRQCVNSTQWNLVNYGYLELVPPYEGRSEAVRALRNSCTSSFPIVFLEGALEATVYLRTISKYSGITISVFDEVDKLITAVRYQRSNKNFVRGWVTVSVPVKIHTTGFVQISGQSLNNELVIVDSLRYIPRNSTLYSLSDVEDERITTLTKFLQETSEPDELIFAFSETEGDDDDIESSGETETEPSVTEDPDSGTEPSVTEDPDSGTEDPDATETPDSATEDPDSGTEDPDSGTEDPDATEDPDSGTEDPNATEDPDSGTQEPSPEEDRENSEDDGFWNVFTITFVSVGAFTAVGLASVGAYYLGKSRGVSQNPPLDLESLEAPSIIPRARSVFSDTTYDRYDRFGRFS